MAQLARLERDNKYRTQKDDTLVLQGVPFSLHAALRKMVTGRVLHQQVADATGTPLPSGKVCAHRAFKSGLLDKPQYHSYRKRLELADEGKHDVKLSAKDAWHNMSDSSDHDPGTGRDSVPPPPASEWDADDDDDDDGKNSPACQPTDDDQLPAKDFVLNRGAAEFLPQSTMPQVGTFVLPGIGTQLDFVLQDLVNKCNAFEKRMLALESSSLSKQSEEGCPGGAEVPQSKQQVAVLSARLDAIESKTVLQDSDEVSSDSLEDEAHRGLGEVFARLRNAEEKLKEIPAQVVQGVMAQLPNLIASTLPSCIGSALETAVGPVVEVAINGSMDRILGKKFKETADMLRKEFSLSRQMPDGRVALHEIKAVRPIVDAAVRKMRLEPGCATSAEIVPTPPGEKLAAVDVMSVAQSDIESGDTVIINGLERAPELNGKVGVVNGVDSKTGRYIIDVEGCQGTRRIKRCNILAMSDLGDDSDYNADA